jgi:hypothetical protein
MVVVTMMILVIKATVSNYKRINPICAHRAFVRKEVYSSFEHNNANLYSVDSYTVSITPQNLEPRW